MSYENFDNKHRQQKKLIITWSAIVILGLVGLLVMLQGRQNYLIYKTSPHLEEEFLAKDICFAGFNSIVKKGGVPSLIESGYLKVLEDSNYSAVDFTLDKKDYRRVEMTSENICKIIIKDRNTAGHGLRSFKIKLRGNSEYLFFYKIYHIQEFLLEEQDLKWR